jgi:flavin-dependent dehydrogenase
MKTYRYDVVIVGAGPAGVTAAGALAGSGISVALIETAPRTGPAAYTSPKASPPMNASAMRPWRQRPSSAA